MFDINSNLIDFYYFSKLFLLIKQYINIVKFIYYLLMFTFGLKYKTKNIK